MLAILHIAIGSNRWHGRYGAPPKVVAAAIVALGSIGTVVVQSSIRTTRPLGPSKRAFANAVVALASDWPVYDVLLGLKAIERDFGRRRGRRWAARVLDLDIVAAGTTTVHGRTLTVPHIAIAVRRFVLDPLAEIAPGWRHPLLHLTARQLRERERRPKSQAAGSP